MEEDEEVDIVGGLDNFMSKNEREISNISSGQILSCEYLVHPRWLADNNDGTELWPENLPKQSSQDEMELVQDEVVIEEPAPIDFNWCEEQETEEISNCGDIILEQDIPASLEEEVVTNSGTEAEYDDNSDYCSQSSNVDSCHSNLNLKSPTSTGIDERQCKQNFSLHSRGYTPIRSNPRSLLKKNLLNLPYIKRPPVKFKQTLMVNKNLLKLNQLKFNTDPSAGTSLLKSNIREREKKVFVKKAAIKSKPIPKFKQSVLLKWNLPHPKCQPKKIKNTGKKYKERSAERSTSSSSKSKASAKIAPIENASGKGTKMFVDLHGENITINHDAESGVTDLLKASHAIAAPLIDANVVKVKYESESDVEIDIESDTPNDLNELHHSVEILSEIKQEMEVHLPCITLDKCVERKPKAKVKLENQQLMGNCATYSEDMLNVLNSLKNPFEELFIDAQTISELEKYFHAEFFEGRPTKTPERYIKIRDFILNAWKENKPAYVSKTTVRNGLKHCGDVNCISRIHCMLEQIGAINFRHAGEHFEYIRPLTKLKEHFVQSLRNKQSISGGGYEMNSSSALILGRRQRMKSVSLPTEREMDANYTVSHLNGIPTLVFPTMPKERECHRRDASKAIKVEFELIECLRFTKDKIPPFKISITLSTLLCLHLHALSSKFEVMGFLGGYYTKSVGRTKLSLTRYKPCRTAHQSGTTCEMCPVSQVEQASSLTSEGYDLLGWFHSHPTFEPNPSRTDVATQADMQNQFSMEGDRPFIGFILGCIDMRYNCMYILPKDLHNDTNDVIPYGFEVDVIKDCSSLKTEIGDVFNVIDRQSENYVSAIEKFTRTATDLLKRHSYEWSISDYLQSYL